MTEIRRKLWNNINGIDFDISSRYPENMPLAMASAELNDTTTHVIFRFHHPDGLIRSETYILSASGESETIDVSEFDIQEDESYSGYLVSAGTTAVSASDSVLILFLYYHIDNTHALPVMLLIVDFVRFLIVRQSLSITSSRELKHSL